MKLVFRHRSDQAKRRVAAPGSPPVNETMLVASVLGLDLGADASAVGAVEAAIAKSMGVGFSESVVLGPFALTPDTWYDSANVDWPLTNMPVAYHQMATCVDDDGNIHLVGGHNGSNYLDTHRLYNPVTNAWSTLAVLPATRQQGTLCWINGKGYFAGGENSSGTAVANTWEYDPVLNAWAAMDAMPAARKRSAYCVHNSKMYVMAGRGTSGSGETTNYEFDPSQAPGSQWATKAAVPAAAEYCHSASDGTYIFFWRGAAGSTIYNSFHRYDPGANTWHATVISGIAARHRGALGCPFLLGGHFHSTGGRATSTGAAQSNNFNYDTTQAWEGSAWGGARADMITGRYALSAVVREGILYTFGGINSVGTIVAVVEAYVPPEGANRPY